MGDRLAGALVSQLELGTLLIPRELYLPNEDTFLVQGCEWEPVSVAQ